MRESERTTDIWDPHPLTYCRDPPLFRAFIAYDEALEFNKCVILIKVYSLQPNRLEASANQCAVPARLGALHLYPHATVTLSPWVGGTRQYFEHPHSQ